MTMNSISNRTNCLSTTTFLPLLLHRFAVIVLICGFVGVCEWNVEAVPFGSDFDLNVHPKHNNKVKNIHYDHYIPALLPPIQSPPSSSSSPLLSSSLLSKFTNSRLNLSLMWNDCWSYRFMLNVVGYLAIIAPIAIVVCLVKFTTVLPDKFSQNPLIRLLVYGIDCESVCCYHYKYDLLPSNDIQQDNKKNDQLPLVQSDLLRENSDSSINSSFKQFYLAKLLYCFFGLQFSYLIWGLLQEKIMTQHYDLESSFFDSSHHRLGHNLIQIQDQFDRSINNSAISNSESGVIYRIKFQNSQFLVFINRISALIISSSILLYQNRGHLSRYLFGTVQPPLYLYLYCSLSNILSSWCQYEALKFVSFPAQVLSKACKMIPVMVMSQLVSGKKFRKTEWLFAVAISFGMTLFLLNEHDDQKHRHLTTTFDDHHHNLNLKNSNPEQLETDSTVANTMISGIVILSLYLTFDSFTSNWQSKLFEQYKLSTIHMMAAVNFYSVLLTSISLIEQSDFIPAFKLLLANPSLLRDSTLLSLCSASGQLFIFYTISTFGPIIFTLIMTLRQAFAILLSCFTFSHSISAFGFVGILVVFVALFSNIYYKSQQNKKHRT